MCLARCPIPSSSVNAGLEMGLCEFHSINSVRVQDILENNQNLSDTHEDIDLLLLSGLRVKTKTVPSIQDDPQFSIVAYFFHS